MRPEAGPEAREDAVAAEQEVLAQAARDEGGPEAPGLHESDGEEAQALVGVEDETGRQQGREGLGREGIRDDEGVAEERLDRERVPAEAVEQGHG